MKAMVVGILLLVVAAAGFGTYQYVITSKPQDRTFTTQSIVKTGKVQKLTPPGDDYTHLLITTDGTVKLNSQKGELNQYDGKNVQVTGQYSGNTLYVDLVEEK